MLCLTWIVVTMIKKIKCWRQFLWSEYHCLWCSYPISTSRSIEMTLTVNLWFSSADTSQISGVQKEIMWMSLQPSAVMTYSSFHFQRQWHVLITLMYCISQIPRSVHPQIKKAHQKVLSVSRGEGHVNDLVFSITMHARRIFRWSNTLIVI